MRPKWSNQRTEPRTATSIAASAQMLFKKSSDEGRACASGDRDRNDRDHQQQTQQPELAAPFERIGYQICKGGILPPMSFSGIPRSGEIRARKNARGVQTGSACQLVRALTRIRATGAATRVSLLRSASLPPIDSRNHLDLLEKSIHARHAVCGSRTHVRLARERRM